MSGIELNSMLDEIVHSKIKSPHDTVCGDFFKLYIEKGSSPKIVGDFC